MAFIPEYAPNMANVTFYYAVRGASDSFIIDHLQAAYSTVPRSTIATIVQQGRIGTACTEFLNDAGPNVRLSAGLQGVAQPRPKVYVRMSVRVNVGGIDREPVIAVENFGWGTLVRNIIDPTAIRIRNLLTHYSATLVIDPATGFPFYQIHGCTYYPQPITN